MSDFCRHGSLGGRATVLEGCTACQIEDLLDALDTLWGMMPAEQVHEIGEECPGLAELCRHAHHRMSHEQGAVHVPLWATDGASEEE